MSEDKAYKDGDIVWVKLGNNWWPGEVIDAHRHPDGLVTNIKRKLYCIVKFFNENAYEYVSNVKQIYPFQCPKKAEFLKKGLSLYKSGNKFMEKFPEDVEVAERLTRHQVPSVFINDRPDSIVKAILGQPLVLNCDDEYYGSSDYREKRKSSESVTKIINITQSKSAPTSQQTGVENVVSAAAMNLTNTAKNNNFKNDSISSRTSFGGELFNRCNAATNANINNNNYQCNICEFTSVRQNVMILHRKMHSSRNGSNPMASQNTSLNRSNTKVNIPAPATIVVKTSSATTPAMNISSVTSPLNTPTIVINSSKTSGQSTANSSTSDQSTANSSANDSSIIVVTDTSTSSDVDVCPTDSQESQIRRSMRHTTKTVTAFEAEAAHSGVINGSTASIDLPETKPIKKIPKKRDFVNLNLMQDDGINSPIIFDLQSNTTNITQAAASSRPTTPVAKGNAEEIRKMLLEDWSDEDETPDHDNKVASENRKRMDSNNQTVLLSPCPAVTSTPCSGNKTANPNTRIRNIPKKDRRDVILLDFSGELSLTETEKERDVVPIEECSNSSAVEVIEGQQPDVITINDEEEEEEEVDNIGKNSKNKKTSLVSPRRSHFEHVEPNDRSLATSILSCFDFQASDDDDDNDSSAAAGSCTTSTAHFKKKYLSSEKSQIHLKDGNNGKSTTTHEQKQNDEIAEKDQQLTAEIEKLLAITQPPPTDLLTSTNSIEECLSVKDLPIKERGKRIFKSRNRSRIEEKSTNSISTDDSFTKDILSPNKFDNKQSNNQKQNVERLSSSGEAESDNAKASSHIRLNEDIDIVTSNPPAGEYKVIVNSSPDIIHEEQPHDLVIGSKSCDEISEVTKNALTTDASKETCGEIPNVIPNKSSGAVILEFPQPLTSNEFTTIPNKEILTEVRENCRTSPTQTEMAESFGESQYLSVVTEHREEQNEDIQLLKTSSIQEISAVEQEMVPLFAQEEELTTLTAVPERREETNEKIETSRIEEMPTVEQEMVPQEEEERACRDDTDENGSKLTEESTKFASSLETNPLPDDKGNLGTVNLISTIDNEVRVEQITHETTNFCNTVGNVKQTFGTNQDHDAENKKKIVEDERSNDKIIVSIDVVVNKQLNNSAENRNDSNIIAPSTKQEVRSIKVDEMKQKQIDSSVTEEFTSSRLITTTPPTDENSSMGASDTGAEFGSPTSMLSEERLPTFLFSHNDTPQQEVETITKNEANKELTQTVDDNVKVIDQPLANAACESKIDLRTDMKCSKSSNGEDNSEMSTNENHETMNAISTSLSMNDNATYIRLKAAESNELFTKHTRHKLSPDSVEIERAVRKSPTECNQRRNYHKRHSTRRKENKVYMQSVESAELPLETTTLASEDNILHLSNFQEIKVDQNERIKSKLNQSVENVKLQPISVTEKITIYSEESVDTTSLKKPETESLNKEMEERTNHEIQQESLENDRVHVIGDLKNYPECGKVDQIPMLERVDPSENKQTENILLDVANEQKINDKALPIDTNNTGSNKMDHGKTMINKLSSESYVPRSPKKRLGETILLAAPKHKRQAHPEQTEIVQKIDQARNRAVESNMNDNITTESGTKLITAESSNEKQHVSNSPANFTTDNQNVESKISKSVEAAIEDTKHEIIPTECGIHSPSKPKQQDLIIECKTIVPVPSTPDDKVPSPFAPEDMDVGLEIENHTMAAEEIIVEYESIPQENNIIQYEHEAGATMDYESAIIAETNLPTEALPPIIAEKSEQPNNVGNETLKNLSQSEIVTAEQESFATDKSTEDFLKEFDSIVNQTTETKTEQEEDPNAVHVINNLKVQNSKETFTQITSKIPEATNSVEATENQRDQSLLFKERVAIKRRKTICFELAEFGLRVGASSRKRQVIDFEDTLPEGNTNHRRTNERKMTMPDTIDFNSQFKSFKPRRRSSIEDNMKTFSRNWANIDEELFETNFSKLSSELAAKQIGIDSKGNKYVVIKDVVSQPQGSGSVSTVGKQRSDSSDSSLITQRNGRTMKRKSSQSKATTSKNNTKASSTILKRRLSLPPENSCRLFSTSAGCVAIQPKITRDQVINSLNDNQLSTAQKQLMQLQQQQQQQQQVQSSSILLNKQQSNRPRKMHRAQHQSSSSMLQQVQLQQIQQQQQHNVIQQQQQLQQQIITQLSNQQNILQFVTPQIQQQVQPANEGFIIATAATTEDDNVIDSNTQLIALPTQPYPGYTETFLLCKVKGNTCKPVDNVPLYLNHQLNELVPIPLEVLEGTPQIATNNDGTVEVKQCNSQQLVVEDKTTGHITIGEAVLTDAEISNQENVVHEQYLHDNVEAPVNEEEVTADMSSNNGILLNIEGQQVLLDAATFEHLLANPDANTQLISDDGTEYVLTHEVLQALHMQQQQEQQQQQIMTITNAGQHVTGSNNDIIAVAMAGSDLYGNGVLTIDTSQAVQLLEGNSSMVFQQPPTAMVQQHLTPPAVVTNAVLDQSPIMSTLEVPSGSRMQIPHCITVPSIPIVAPSSVILGSGGTHPNLDDSLAAIGVTAQTSAVSSSLGLPITVTDPNIASKVTSAGPLNEILQFVPHRPATAAATAAAVAAAALAGESRIFND